MVKHKGLCPSLKRSVEFDVNEVIELKTKRGTKYQVKGDYEGRTCSTFCSKEKAMELKSALGQTIMSAETEDETGQAHQDESVAPMDNNVQPLSQGQEPMTDMPIQETVATPITGTSVGVEAIDNLQLNDADALANMTTQFDDALGMVADFEIAPQEPEGDGRSIGNIRPMNEDVPLHAESEDGTGQAHQEEGVAPIETDVQPLAEGQEPMADMPIQETVATPITNSSVGVEAIDNLQLNDADALANMATQFDEAPEMLADFEISFMQPFGDGQSIGNNTPMNPDVPLHAETFESPIQKVNPMDETTLTTPPPVCFVEKIPPVVWENMSVLEQIEYAETGNESLLSCPQCGITKADLRDAGGYCAVSDPEGSEYISSVDCPYQKHFAPTHWLDEEYVVGHVEGDTVEVSERLPARVDMPKMKNPQKGLETMVVPYFIWDKIYTQFNGGITAEPDLSGLNYTLQFHGMMKPKIKNLIKGAEGNHDIMFGSETYTATVLKAEGDGGYFIDSATVRPYEAETFGVEFAGDITPQEYPVNVLSYSVDVHKDDYEQGEIGGSVHYWDIDSEDLYFDTKAENQEELLKILNDMIRNEIGGKVPKHEKVHIEFDTDRGYGNAYTDVHATYKEGQGMGIYSYPQEHEIEAWKRGEKELFSLGFNFDIEPIDDDFDAETFEADGGMEFAEWLMNNKPELYFSLLDEKNSPNMVGVSIDKARRMDFAEWMMNNKPELYFSLIDEREEGFGAETFEALVIACDYCEKTGGGLYSDISLYKCKEGCDVCSECLGDNAYKEIQLYMNECCYEHFNVKQPKYAETFEDENNTWFYYNLDRGVYRLPISDGKIIGLMEDREYEMRTGFPNAHELLSTAKEASSKSAKLNESYGAETFEANPFAGRWKDGSLRLLEEEEADDDTVIQFFVRKNNASSYDVLLKDTQIKDERLKPMKDSSLGDSYWIIGKIRRDRRGWKIIVPVLSENTITWENDPHHSEGHRMLESHRENLYGAVDSIMWWFREQDGGLDFYNWVNGSFGAETFDVEFDDWADQEMLTHGKDVSFKEWAKEEGKKHGDMDLTDWAEEEEESHDERYGAEEGAFYQIEVKYNMEDGWEHYGDYDDKQDAINAYYDIYLEYPEVKLVEVDYEDGYVADEIYSQRNFNLNAEIFESPATQDKPSLKSVGLLLGVGALATYLAPKSMRDFLNRLK